MSTTEDRLQALFESFIDSGRDEGLVRQVYEAQPYLTGDQMRVYLLWRHTALRWGSEVLSRVADEYLELQKQNRPVGLQFNKMLQSVSLYTFTREMMKPPAGIASQQTGGRRL